MAVLKTLKKILFDQGLLASITLSGILLLSAVLYYRAVKVQRFLEPALAISQPKIEFARKINRIVSEEFKDKKSASAVFYTTDSIVVDGSMLIVGEGAQSDLQLFEGLGHVFLSILNDPDMKKNIDLILISVKVYLEPNNELNKIRRMESQGRADFILNALYEAEPGLEKDYRSFFSTAAIPVSDPQEARWVEFKIVPARRLHIDMFQRLERYVK